MAFGVFGLAGLAACASPAPAMRDERTAVISGRETVGDAPADAVQKALVLAAQITVDHGFRYFRIVGSADQSPTDRAIRPGADVTIKVFHDGETSTRVAGIWDAEALLTTGPQSLTGLANAATPMQSSPPPTPNARAQPAPPVPRCTAYGCDW
ncbi:MAG: hypothetical protein ACLQUZ_09925 [Rhizomicrobium sp.]